MAVPYKPLYIPLEERRLPVMLVDTTACVLRVPLCYMPPDFIRLAYDIFRRQLAAAETKEVRVPSISLDGAPLLGMESLRSCFKRLVDAAQEEEVFEFFFRNALVTYDVVVSSAEGDTCTRVSVRLLAPDRVALPTLIRGDSFFVMVHKNPTVAVAAHVLAECHRGGALEGEHLATAKNSVAEIFVDNVYLGLGVVECPTNLRALSAEYPEYAELFGRTFKAALQLTVHERAEAGHAIPATRSGVGVTIKHPHPHVLCTRYGYTTFARARGVIAEVIKRWMEAMDETSEPTSMLLHALASHALDVALTVHPRATPLIVFAAEGDGAPCPSNFRVRAGPVCSVHGGRSSMVGVDVAAQLCRHKKNMAWLQAAARRLVGVLDEVKEAIANPRSGWGDALARHVCRHGGDACHHGNSALRAHVVHTVSTYLTAASKRCGELCTMCRGSKHRRDPDNCLSRWLL